jgi:hypothetical protein
MDRIIEIEKGTANFPTQTFKGKQYSLYNGEKYFSRGNKRLHTEVWKFHKGEIPKDYHVHHVDGNQNNNEISNLNLVHKTLHQRFEAKKRFKNNPEFAKSFHAKGIEAAKEWHKSKQGIEWHKKNGKECWINKPFTDKICEQCGKDYKTRHSGISKYCHQNCKATALRARRKLQGSSI